MNIPVHIRLCPTCGRENPSQTLRCTCGALLTGVDLTLQGASQPALPSQVTTAAAAGVLCPHDDCAQHNPAGSEVCFYCNRPLTQAEAEDADHAAPSGHLLQLPKELRQRFRVREVMPAAGAEAELFIVEPKTGGAALVAKVYRHGIHPKDEVLQGLKAVDPAHKVVVQEWGTADGFTYELMEYCPIGSLRPYLAAGPLTPSAWREVAQELIMALAAIHAAHLIHRDLKPENILIRCRQPLDLVLTDFGTASVRDMTVLFTGMARTLAYSAPESLAGVLDEKADYWSLGMILLEAWLGQHPFAGLSDAVILHRLTTRSVDLSPVLESEAKTLLRGLLQRDPKQRWGAREAAQWLDGSPDLAPPAEDLAPSAVKPYLIGEDRCTSREQLAVALARNWRLGALDLESGLLLNWVRQELQDQNLARCLIELNLDRQMHRDVRLLRFLLFLAPGLPPVWRGESISLGAVLAQAGKALKNDAEAGAWLVDLVEHRVLPAYAQAGNAELGDLLQRWQGALDAFDQGWNEAEAYLRQRPRQGEIVYFDDLVFGQNAGINPPPAALVHARLLALCYDPSWVERLRKLLVAEVSRLGVDCPWLLELGAAETCPPPKLLVLHGFLPEAKRQAGLAAEKRVELAAQRDQAQAQFCQEAGATLGQLARCAQARVMDRNARMHATEALDSYHLALAQGRGLGALPEAAQALRNRLTRAEPYANRIGRELEALEVRQAMTGGWLNIGNLITVAVCWFGLLLFNPRWATALIYASVGVILWRLVPSWLIARRIREFGRRLAALADD